MKEREAALAIADTSPLQPRSSVDKLRSWTAPMRGALAAGAIAGILVAGLGSRIAMRLIFLADKGTDGILTSDQFIVGRVSTDTFNLLALGTVVGVLVAPIYLGLRRWLPIPRAWRGLAFGYGSLVTGGTILINDDSVDFRIFEPVMLGVGLFAGLFILGGILLGALMDRFHPDPVYPNSARVPRVAGAVLALVAVLGTLIFLAGTVALVDKEGSCVASNTDFECIPAARLTR
ncbi:MAG: hypothetical protein WD472_03010 [Dehalococcoidia bacterium]